MELGGGLISGTIWICRPPQYEHMLFLKNVSLKLCRGGGSLNLFVIAPNSLRPSTRKLPFPSKSWWPKQL